jgi:hypothetical protein
VSVSQDSVFEPLQQDAGPVTADSLTSQQHEIAQEEEQQYQGNDQQGVGGDWRGENQNWDTPSNDELSPRDEWKSDTAGQPDQTQMPGSFNLGQSGTLNGGQDESQDQHEQALPSDAQQWSTQQNPQQLDSLGSSTDGQVGQPESLGVSLQASVPVTPQGDYSSGDASQGVENWQQQSPDAAVAGDNSSEHNQNLEQAGDSEAKDSIPVHAEQADLMGSGSDERPFWSNEGIVNLQSGPATDSGLG